MTAPTATLPHYFERIAARRARVVELTHRGHSAREIGEFLGITTRSVVRIRREMGIARPANNSPMSADELRTAARMLADGCSFAEVARTLGRSDTTICKRFPGQGWDPVECGRLVALNRWIKQAAGIAI